eukprot:scaffold106363_cov28-Tisochrysis_lutea.AAC.1
MSHGHKFVHAPHIHTQQQQQHGMPPTIHHEAVDAVSVLGHNTHTASIACYPQYIMRPLMQSLRSHTRAHTHTMAGMARYPPYIMRPPMRSARSNTVTSWPILLSWSAAARPAGPLPTMATLAPVRWLGGRGTIQPSSKACR